MSEFVDDRREQRLADHVTCPEKFDKLGDPVLGSKNPGRCHVCLAWVAYPFSEGSLTACPDCHDKSEGDRELVREKVREALADVWRGSA